MINRTVCCTSIHFNIIISWFYWFVKSPIVGNIWGQYLQDNATFEKVTHFDIFFQISK